ncbi:hypothetical protein [Paenibacillus sp. HW567]|uniref:hypothetical protein n=1 Tax=Paenibacillus sp. HW567 TaxID=1034769 RepID=UPI000379C5DA|nr:hypothetical protein [Paenibacillus sp. HW567]
MKLKHSLVTAAVVAVSGGLLALSAVIVPGMVNSTALANHVQMEKLQGTVSLTNGKVPVLKVEAAAPVSTVEEYLKQKMTQQEMQQIYTYIDNLNEEASMFNREMSEAEVNRRLALNDQYVYEGVRPKALLPLRAGVADFYLDLEKGAFTLPGRDMTDEELLQLIDWSYREMYALNQRNTEQPPGPGAKDIQQAEAIKLAAASVKKLFNVDISKLDSHANYSLGWTTKQGQWFVDFRPYKSDTLRSKGEQFLSYNVLLDAKTGVVLDTTVVDLSYKRTAISAAAMEKVKKDASWIAAAKQIVTQKQGETRKIASAKINGDSSYLKRGLVSVLIKLADGSTYNAELRYPEKTLRCLMYEAAGTAK